MWIILIYWIPLNTEIVDVLTQVVLNFLRWVKLNLLTMIF